MNKRGPFIISIFLLAVSAAAAGFYFYSRMKSARLPAETRQTDSPFGKISVITETGTIRLKGRVAKNTGWAQHLIYLPGYKWLKDESAIIAEGELSALQNAVAFLDWRLWDELWHRTKPASPNNVPVYVKWALGEAPANNMVSTEDELSIGDFIFLGTPYFDQLALESSFDDCSVCPVFELEEKALRDMFIRKSGKSGYELNSSNMPPLNTEVEIIIILENKK